MNNSLIIKWRIAKQPKTLYKDIKLKARDRKHDRFATRTMTLGSKIFNTYVTPTLTYGNSFQSNLNKYITSVKDIA